MANVERRLVAMGVSAGGRNFMLVEEQVNRNLIAYPVWVDNYSLNCNLEEMIESMDNAGKIRASQRFKKELIKAYKVSEFEDNEATIVEKNKGHYSLFIKASNVPTGNIFVRLEDPKAIMGKKIKSEKFMVSHMFTYGATTFLVDSVLSYKSINFTLAFNFTVNLFQPPRGWTFIKTEVLGE